MAYILRPLCISGMAVTFYAFAGWIFESVCVCVVSVHLLSVPHGTNDIEKVARSKVKISQCWL